MSLRYLNLGLEAITEKAICKIVRSSPLDEGADLRG
jgi:hypothetical protein